MRLGLVRRRGNIGQRPVQDGGHRWLQKVVTPQRGAGTTTTRATRRSRRSRVHVVGGPAVPADAADGHLRAGGHGTGSFVRRRLLMPQKEREGATLIHDRTPPMALAQAALELVGRDPGGATTAADEAVAAARVSHDRAARAVALRARSLAERELGRIPAALRSGQASVRAAAAAGDDDLEAEARMSLAFVLLERGSVTAALRQADRSAGQTQGLAAARLSTQRALILQRTGRGAEALAAYAQALPVLRRGHDTVWEARLRNNRGLLHAYHGSLRDAEADLRVALALHESAGASLSAADSWWNLGFVAARKGDAPTALQHFDAAAEIYRRHGLPVQELMLDRVELLLGVGAVGEARRTAQRAVAGLEAADLGLHLPEALLLLAQATIADGRPERRARSPPKPRGSSRYRADRPGRSWPGTSGCSPTSAPDTTRPSCCASHWPSPSRYAAAGGGCTSSTSGSPPPSWPCAAATRSWRPSSCSQPARPGPRARPRSGCVAGTPRPCCDCMTAGQKLPSEHCGRA